MAVFKRKRRNAKGVVTPDRSYTIKFVDHNGITRRIAGFSDKSASLQLERTFKRLVEIRMSDSHIDGQLSRALDACPKIILQKLAKWGMIEARRIAGDKSLSDHIADWQVALEMKGDTTTHIKVVAAKVMRLVKFCGWKYLADANLDEANRWIRSRKKARVALQTINHDIQAVRGLWNWLVQEGKTTFNPFVNLVKFNVQTDRKRERKPFSIDELKRLLQAAKNGGEIRGVTGYERTLLYLLAFTTGLRFGEIFHLTRASFDFESKQATVTVTAKYAKNRRKAVLPLRKDVAAALKQHIGLFLPTTKAFPNLPKGRGAYLIQCDAKAAGIAVVDESGLVLDFHSLRHTFASELSAAGVPLVMAQQLMQHSDPRLTSGIYTHTTLEAQGQSVESLPTLQFDDNTVAEGA